MTVVSIVSESCHNTSLRVLLLCAMYVCVGAAAAAREDRGNPVGVTCLTFTKEAEKKYASCTSPMIKRVICRSST